jgi:hypothetical protein
VRFERNFTGGGNEKKALVEKMKRIKNNMNTTLLKSFTLQARDSTLFFVCFQMQRSE